MRQSHQTELHVDLIVSFHVEPLESVILFDIPKHSFWFDRTIASVIQSAFTGQQFTHMVFISFATIVDFHTPFIGQLLYDISPLEDSVSAFTVLLFPIPPHF